MKMKIPVEVSARHIHLSEADMFVLFGDGYVLRKDRDLTQPSDFVAQESLTIKGKNSLENVRVVGPLRNRAQVELSITDAISLGIEAPIRISGDLDSSPGVVLVGPKGEVLLKEGVIIDKRHIHCATEEAKLFKLKNGQIVSVAIEGERALTFNNVIVRVSDNYKLCMHIDTDEGNAAGINKKTEGIIIK